MLKLVVVSVLASIVSVQCGTILAPAVGRLVSEKVIEAHGNSVVHASAPLVAAVAQPAFLKHADVALVQHPVVEIAQPLTKAALVAERTIEAHGHQVIHNAQPLIGVAKPPIQSHVAIPTLAARGLAYPHHYAPIYYSAYPHQLVAEKTVSSYGHSIQHLAGPTKTLRLV
ncbi:uncharacterized protein [Linepithema humile]|uniref:uncharacterized protein n=1 Tax=Linepithema humile TaxID=83485 RepID=UPI00351EF445